MNTSPGEIPCVLDGGPLRTDARRPRDDGSTLALLLALLPYLCAVTFSGLGSLCTTSCGGRPVPETETSGHDDTDAHGSTSDGQTENSDHSGTSGIGTQDSETSDSGSTSTGPLDDSSEGGKGLFYVSGMVVGASAPLETLGLSYGTPETGFQYGQRLDVGNGAFAFPQALEDGDRWSLFPDWPPGQTCTEPSGTIESADAIDVRVECADASPCLAMRDHVCIEGDPRVEECPPGFMRTESSCARDGSPTPDQFCCQFVGE